jgi:hypothetical protein
MKQVGFDDTEIEYWMINNPPTDFEYECRQFRSAVWLDENTPAASILENWAIRY